MPDTFQAVLDLHRDLAAMRGELNLKIDNGFSAQTDRATAIAADLALHKVEDAQIHGKLTGNIEALGDMRRSVQWGNRTAIGALILYAIKVVFFSGVAK